MTLNVNIDMYLGCDVTNPTKKKERWRDCVTVIKSLCMTTENSF